MKTHVALLLIFISVSQKILAQNKPSAGYQYESLRDSLHAATNIQYTVDSLKILSWADSLRSRINLAHSLDSVNLAFKIDSLQNLSLSSLPYTRKLDSLLQKKDALINEVETKKQAVWQQTKDKLQQWQTKVQEKLGIAKLPNGNFPDLPATDLPGLPDVGVPDMATLDLPEVPSLSLPELHDLDLSPDLSAINKSVSLPEFDALKDLQSSLSKGSEALSTVSSLTSDTDNIIGQSIDNVSQLGEVKEQLQFADGITDNEFMETAEKMKDPEALQEEVKQQVVKKAVNHFAGKEQVLQEAMDKMAKYKAKYESLNSLSEVKKRPPNPMKGKPFIERLVPGVAFQILRNDNLFLDINPYVGYRITGRLTSGVGWNQRIGYSTKDNYFTSPSVIYGPRMFTEFKVWKGFSGRFELEVMNTFVPPLFKPLTPDNGNREWVYTAMAGIKKEYRFMKGVKGTAFVMFNLYDPKHKSPYGDVINSRFGFEFPLKKKSKAAAPTNSQ